MRGGGTHLNREHQAAMEQQEDPKKTVELYKTFRLKYKTHQLCRVKIHFTSKVDFKIWIDYQLSKKIQ